MIFFFFYLILNLKLHAIHHKICHSLALFHPIIDPELFLFTAVINTASISDLCAVGSTLSKKKFIVTEIMIYVHIK